MRKLTAAAMATMLAITPIASANATAGTGIDTGTAFPEQQQDDNDFPWGLLGLLGLAGLLGMKRRDDDHRATSDRR